MKCPKCQFENPEDTKFCGECGVKLERICSSCHSSNQPEFKFCGECGHYLRNAEETALTDYSQPQSYTPRFLADKILTNRSAIEGERKLVTVLFADVANYTAMAENLDLEEVHQIMDSFFKILMEEIHKYEGTINQFTGDGVMALFGAPVAHEDHAQRACYAALSIQNAISRYGGKIKKDFGPDFKMRIGLNSGPVVVGAIGDDLRMDYTAVGDTTNLASRMEGMAKPGAVMISKNTYKMTRDFFVFESVGRVPVKGKEQPQAAYELIKPTGFQTRIEAAAAKGLTKFVGRRPEMDTLKSAFEKAQSGSGQLVGIVGEAGVGKSRILLELRNMLADSESTYIEGRCLHYGGAMAYLPILDILRMYFEIKEGDQELVIKESIKEKVVQLDKNLVSNLSPFQDLLSIRVEEKDYIKLEPQQKRERIFEALRDLFIRLSQDRPLILAVEDLHWIDKTTEEYLNYLIEWLANTRILLILLYRPEYTHAWGSKSYYTKVGVDQLSTDTGTELVQSILEDGEVVPELRELILNKTGGNPLFMEEFTHTLLENGTIQKKEYRYVLSKKAQDIQIPDTIEGIITARIDRLEDTLKRTIQVASVIGREFSFRLLQIITGMTEELKAHLFSLQGLEFIYEKQLFPELEYIFKHILTQEVAYNSLLARRRKEIHEKVGKAIEKIYSERLEEFYEMLAYHYSKSHNFKKAYRYLRLSGIKSIKKHLSWEAFYHYKEALNALNQLPATRKNKEYQIEICRLLHAPLMILTYPNGCEEVFKKAVKLCDELGDTQNLARFYMDLGFYHRTKGDYRISIEYGEKALFEAKTTNDAELIITVTNDLCYSYRDLGHYLKIIELAPSGIDMIKKTKKENEIFKGRAANTYTTLCSIYGHSMGITGNFAEGRAYCAKAIQVAAKINHLRSLGQSEYSYGHLCCLEGDHERAIEHLQRSIQLLEESKYFWILIYANNCLGWAYYLCGKQKKAVKYVEIAVKMQNDFGLLKAISMSYRILSAAYFELSNWEKALECIGNALTFAQKHNEKEYEGLSLIWKGRILGKSDLLKRVEAEDFIARGVEILEELKLKALYSVGYLSLGEFYAETSQKQKALESLEKAEEMFKEMGMDYYLTKTQEVLNRF